MFCQHLTTNPQIHKSDPIVLFYAGHASRKNRMFEVIPCDMQTINEEGKETNGISNTMIVAMLEELTSEKGDNIVRIAPLFTVPE